jgi:hypothetical protein
VFHQRARARRRRKLEAREISPILHATTVATNTVLEGKGARTSLVLTAGFRDVLEIARQRRPSLYDLTAEKAKPLVPRRLCFEVIERIASDGSVITELTQDEMARVAIVLRESRAESVVIALLFSYLNPAHEKKLKAYLERELPDKHIIASAEVIPEFREFERASTAALVGYLRPIFHRYTQDLARELAALGHATGKLLIMNSAGGLMSPEAASERPHTVVESGPAAGVIAAATLARQLGERNVISSTWAEPRESEPDRRRHLQTTTGVRDRRGHEPVSPALYRLSDQGADHRSDRVQRRRRLDRIGHGLGVLSRPAQRRRRSRSRALWPRRHATHGNRERRSVASTPITLSAAKVARSRAGDRRHRGNNRAPARLRSRARRPDHLGVNSHMVRILRVVSVRAV